jgi:hypothetical protein
MDRKPRQDRNRRLDSIAPMEVLPQPVLPERSSWHMPLIVAIAIGGTFGVVATHLSMQEMASRTGAVGHAVSAAGMVPTEDPAELVTGVAAGLKLEVRQAGNESAPLVPYIDRQAASWELAEAAAAAKSCMGAGDPGAASVKVTFAASGEVTSASVGGELQGTSKAACIAQAMKQTRIEPFDGDPLVIRTLVPLR